MQIATSGTNEVMIGKRAMWPADDVHESTQVAGANDSITTMLSRFGSALVSIELEETEETENQELSHV